MGMLQKELMYNLYRTIGPDYQLVILQEELSELSQAIAKYQRHRIKQEEFGQPEGDLEKIMKDITGETADVMIAISGMVQYFKLEQDIYHVKQEKIARTEERAKDYLSEKIQKKNAWIER